LIHWINAFTAFHYRKMVTPDARRDAVTHAHNVHAVSQRRVCLILQVDRSSVRPDDTGLREAM